MRPTASVLGFGVAGCQAVPDLAAQPHGTLAGTHPDVDGDRYDNFHVRKIDGMPALPDVDRPTLRRRRRGPSRAAPDHAAGVQLAPAIARATSASARSRASAGAWQSAR